MTGGGRVRVVRVWCDGVMETEPESWHWTVESSATVYCLRIGFGEQHCTLNKTFGVDAETQGRHSRGVVRLSSA